MRVDIGEKANAMLGCGIELRLRRALRIAAADNLRVRVAKLSPENWQTFVDAIDHSERARFVWTPERPTVEVAFFGDYVRFIADSDVPNDAVELEAT